MSLMRKSYFDLDWPTWFGRTPFDRFDGWADGTSDLTIRVEEFDTEQHHVIRAEVPGIDPDKDVELTMSDGVLRLMVHRQKREERESPRHYRSEFQYGSFTRLVVLPAGAQESDIKATYDNGILEVKVPVSGHHATEKRIPISRH